MSSDVQLKVPTLRKDSRASLVDQIFGHFQRAIDQGRLRPGDRLPTIREVALGSGVTRTTVQEAYRRLQRQGLVAATVGRGTEVAAGVRTRRQPVSRFAEAAFRHSQTASRVPALSPGVSDRLNFGDLLPDAQLFPVDEFRESIDRALRDRGSELLAYGDPAGSRELRLVLAHRHLQPGQDPSAVAEAMLITSGAQQGIDLVLRTFCAPGDAVAVAVPTYHQLFGMLKAQGLELVPIAGRFGGVDLDELGRALERPDVKLLYVMPTFHNPTGLTMSEDVRREVMRVVEATNVPVLEDEFECELRFAGAELPTLQSMDERGLTATVRSFSKGLLPGVRIGWVQADPAVLGPMSALKRFADLESSPLLQAAMLDFIERGSMDRHLAALRRELGARHRAAWRSLEQSLPAGARWTEPDGGLALWVELPAGLDGDRVAARCAAKGVVVTPGRVFDPFDRPSTAFRLSLSRVGVDEVRQGIRVLGRCVADEIAAGTAAGRPSQPRLMF